MAVGSSLVEFSLRRPRLIAWVVVLVTVLVALAAALPSVWEGMPGPLRPVQVDTDPENMLRPDEPVRVFHNEMKRRLGLHDMVVVGIVNQRDPDGVFNPESLAKVYALTQFAKGLRGAKIGLPDEPDAGVVEVDVIAPSTVDSIEPGKGQVNFRWLMRIPPKTRREAREVRRQAERVPFLDGTLVADKPGKRGKAVCLYLPLTRKDLSYRVYSALKRKIAELGGPEAYHITGLPVAEDTFGVEMFIQMAISAPLAMAVIFVLMLAFFRKLVLILSPMIVALVSVVLTMGALVIAGFPVHIMSSMIPIFIMPIAVLDSIHIISEFFERYQESRNRRRTVLKVMEELFLPMLYTSLTSAAGFASLALTPIPPVQVFGVFVAVGIMVAWVLTVTFIPAFVMFIRPATLENFGARLDAATGRAGGESLLGRFLRWVGGATYRRAKPILAAAAVVVVLAGWGISKIRINDNPVKWFTKGHPIRRADRVLNAHFGGTYMAYLGLLPKTPFDATAFTERFVAQARARAETLGEDDPAVGRAFGELIRLARAQSSARSRGEYFQKLAEAVDRARGAAPSVPAPAPPPSEAEPAVPPGLEGPEEPPLPEGAAGEPALPGGIEPTASAPATTAPAVRADAQAWDQVRQFLDELRQQGEVFKRPEVLEYVRRLQQRLAQVRVGGRQIVGKSNSLADIVMTVRRDLYSGTQSDYRLPTTKEGPAAVAQLLEQFQSSHRRRDLWHFVTPDFRTSAIWLQLTSGDNRDMEAVARAAAAYIDTHPPPADLAGRWFGLTYINVEWQNKMVAGMLQAFGGSFLVVLLLMTILFRSPLWGLLSMIPLTVTIGAIYGVIGFIGKDYDMPVAVLSSLTLGLAVDFAIHFLARSREMRKTRGCWARTAPAVFGEPARAIARNILVIAAGFLPLLLAPLVPYRTVGVFLAAILLVSGVGTLILLPALMRVLEARLFVVRPPMGQCRNCALCATITVVLVGVVALNLHQFTGAGWSTLTWVSGAVVVAMAIVCGILSRRQRCRERAAEEEVCK